MSDAWKEIQAGDKEAFKQVFDNYYQPLCLYANKILNDLGLAQDLVSESFVNCWEKRASIEIKSSLKNYLLLVVRNAALMHLRQTKEKHWREHLSLQEIDVAEEHVKELEGEEQVIRVHQAINKLPEQRRKILQLAVYNNLSYKEIATFLGISVNTVKTQMGRAYRFLKEELKGDQLTLFLLFGGNFE